jgi:hypothetical protein
MFSSLRFIIIVSAALSNHFTSWFCLSFSEVASRSHQIKQEDLYLFTFLYCRVYLKNLPLLNDFRVARSTPSEASLFCTVFCPVFSLEIAHDLSVHRLLNNTLLRNNTIKCTGPQATHEEHCVPVKLTQKKKPSTSSQT